MVNYSDTDFHQNRHQLLSDFENVGTWFQVQTCPKCNFKFDNSFSLSFLPYNLENVQMYLIQSPTFLFLNRFHPNSKPTLPSKMHHFQVPAQSPTLF